MGPTRRSIAAPPRGNRRGDLAALNSDLARSVTPQSIDLAETGYRVVALRDSTHPRRAEPLDVWTAHPAPVRRAAASAGRSQPDREVELVRVPLGRHAPHLTRTLAVSPCLALPYALYRSGDADFCGRGRADDSRAVRVAGLAHFPR